MDAQEDERMSGFSALVGRELKKWYTQPITLFISLIQPIIWMVLFGKAFNLTALASSTPGGSASFEAVFGTSDYFSYMAVGMLSFVLLFTTMMGGMSIVFDRRLGFLNKVLSTPVSRGSVILSKVFSSVIRSLVQAGIVIIMAVLIGLKVAADFNPVYMLGVFAALFLLAMGLSAMFVTIAIRSSRFETQMAVVNLLNLPLLFCSNALFPTQMMPPWIRSIAHFNPISYATDVGHQLILHAPNHAALVNDFVFLGVFAAVFSAIGIVLSWRFLSK